MNIVVCIKQVPDTTEIKIDPVKNTLIRDGVPSILNTFDGFALEEPIRSVRAGDGVPDPGRSGRKCSRHFHGTASGKGSVKRGTGHGSG